MPDGASSGPSVSKPGCPDKCGDVSIPYPFGIGEQCSAASLNSYFNLTCNNTLNPPQPTVGDSTSGYYEITNISLEQGEVRVLTSVSYICFTSNTTSTQSSNGFYADVTPFLPSPTRNRFTVIGCNTLGLIGGYKDAASQYVTGCYSYCEDINSTSDSAQCAGMGCCEANIPANLTSYSLGFEMNQSRVWGFNPCFYAMIAEVEWYSFRQQDLVGSHGFIDARAKSGAPLIADWAIRNGSCPEEGKEPPSGYACASTNSNCTAANNGPGYLCQCSKGYEGNPYILNGCQEIPLDLRLKIATQSAEALAYLHSSISCTILHGDVKSDNILLDDQHNAKIADFGASAQKSMDESEFIMLVQAHMFLLMFRQNKHRAMMDFEIIDEAVMEMLEKLAQLAAQCLCPSGDDRPTRKEVVERLQMLRRLHKDATTDYEDSNYAHSNHGGSSSLTAPLDDMTYSSMETSMMIQV
nr:unnamed protein product [Digitaria exilis]